MQMAVDRDQLQQRAKESGERFEVLRGPWDVITDGAPPQAGSDTAKPTRVDERFARFLGGEREALRHRPS